jgi:outer membrane protein W
MLRRIVLLVSLAMLVTVPSFAQAPKAEVGVTIGGAVVSGVRSSSPVVVPQGSFDTIGPKNSFIWAADVGIFLGPNAEVGFIYSQQPSKLQVSGATATVDIGDSSIHTYHFTFAYNFGDADAKFRPYVMGGLGGTSYGDVNYTTPGGVSGTLNGFSRFTSTWGAGMKFYGSSKVGGKFGVRFTPTHISTTTTGWWCDPYWGCYATGTAQYSSQFAVEGGVTYRF